MLRNKFNQGGKRSVHWKLSLMKETEKKTQINANPWAHTHESRELILLKFLYYIKPTIDSKEFQPKFQWHFFTEIEIKCPKAYMEQKRPQQPKQSQDRTKLVAPHILISNYMTKQ